MSRHPHTMLPLNHIVNKNHQYWLSNIVNYSHALLDKFLNLAKTLRLKKPINQETKKGFNFYPLELKTLTMWSFSLNKLVKN